MSKLMIALCLLLSGLCFIPAISIAADEEKAKEKEEAPKPMPKEKEDKKKPKSTIEWTEITSKSGVLKKAEYKKNAKQAEPMRIEFSSEAPAVRIKWTTKAPEGTRGGSISMSLVKKKEGRGSEDKATYQRVDRLGNARGASEGGKTLSLPKGDYAIELEGDAIEYEITVEAAEKKTAE